MRQTACVALAVVASFALGVWGGVRGAFLIEPYRYQSDDGHLVRIERTTGKAQLLLGLAGWHKVPDEVHER
jgi:hypothetical protein